MLRTSIVLGFLVLVGFGACVPCDSQVTESTIAPRPDFDQMIDACVTKHSCMLLCRGAFELDPTIQIERCTITKVVATGAYVTVRYYDENACAADYDTSDDFDWGDDGYDTSDDGTDDGSTDDGSGGGDGSTDDGSGSDDGSTDDGSTDDGSTDTMDYRKAPVQIRHRPAPSER